MTKLDALTLDYMHTALVKEAAGGQLIGRGLPGLGGYLRRAAGDVGAGAGVGSAVGAVGGAATEGYKGYKEDGVAGALSRGVGGGMHGAAIGAGIGAGAGLAGGGRFTSSAAGKALMQSNNALASTARFGQRQLHGVTGLTPGGAPRLTAAGEVNPAYVEAVKGMRMGTYGPEKGVSAAWLAKVDAMASGAKPKKLQKLQKQFGNAQDALQTSEEAVGKGMTSLPGVVQAVRKEGLKPLWTHGVKPQFTQSGWSGKALTALPAAMAAPELMKDEDSAGKGRGRAERFGQALGEGSAFAAAPFLPLAGADVMSRGTGKASGLAGKALDKLIGSVRPKKPGLAFGESPGVPATDGDGGGQAVERVQTNAALGKPPEDMQV